MKVDTTPADTVPDRIGQAVLVRGVVTSVDFRGGTGIEYYIQDPTGGIDVFNTTDLGPALSVGTNVEVSGTLTQFNGLTEMTPTSITILARRHAASGHAAGRHALAARRRHRRAAGRKARPHR